MEEIGRSRQGPLLWGCGGDLRSYWYTTNCRFLWCYSMVSGPVKKHCTGPKIIQMMWPPRSSSKTPRICKWNHWRFILHCFLLHLPPDTQGEGKRSKDIRIAHTLLGSLLRRVFCIYSHPGQPEVRLQSPFKRWRLTAEVTLFCYQANLSLTGGF